VAPLPSVAFQPVPAKTVQLVAPVDSTPTATVVVPTTVAPAPVESTTTAAPVAAPKEVVVPAPVQSPEPTQGPQVAGHYYDGTPVKTDANGNVVMLPNPLHSPTP